MNKYELTQRIDDRITLYASIGKRRTVVFSHVMKRETMTNIVYITILWVYVAERMMLDILRQ